MKISVVGRSVATGSFVSHIAAGFAALGHEASVHEFRLTGEPRRGRLANVGNLLRANVVSRSPTAINVFYRGLLGELRRVSPDLIVTTRGLVTRDEVNSWRAVAPQARVVVWFPDAISNFGRQQVFGAGVDRIFVKDPYLVDRLGVRGGIRELRYLPEGAPLDAVEWAQQQEDPVARSPAVAMVGNIYPSRVRFLEELVQHVPVSIYGRLHNDAVPEEITAAFTGRFLSGTEKYRTFREARGVLNNLHYAEVASVNYRLFEAAGCGGIVLTDDLPQVRRYLVPGEEVVLFTSAADLAGQLDDLSDIDLARIGAAALARVVGEHLVTHRVGEMLADLGMT